MRLYLLALLLAACGGMDGGDATDDRADGSTDADDGEPAVRWELRTVAGVPDLDDDDADGTPDFAQPLFAADDDRSTLTITAAQLALVPAGGDVALALATAAGDVHIYVGGTLVLGGDAGAGPVGVPVPASGDLVLELVLRDYDVVANLDVLARDAAGATVHTTTSEVRAAPLVMNHHLQPAEHVWAVSVSGNASFIQTYQSVLGSAFTPVPGNSYLGDVWMQDEIEFATLTGDEGQRMDVVIDSIRNRGLDRFPETDLVAPGVIDQTWGVVNTQTTYDSFGNLDASPPVTVNGVAYPFGRIYYGLTNGTTGLTGPLRDFLGAQHVQAPFSVPTAWLCVGHVDEFELFLPDPTSPKGFKLLVADVPAAWTLLQSLPRTAPLSRYAEDHGYPTVGSMLDDTSLVALNNRIQSEDVDPIVTTFMTELGLTEADLIRVPSLWEQAAGCGGKVAALIPGMVNLVVTHADGDPATHVFTADPFFRAAGESQSADPLIADFAARLPDGLTLHYLDNWNTYHLARGEVHCGTNVLRTPSGRWWDEGRHLFERAAPAVVVEDHVAVAADLATMPPAQTRDGRYRFTSPAVHAPGATKVLLARLAAARDAAPVRAAIVEALTRTGGDYRAAIAARRASEAPEVRAMIDDVLAR